MIGIHIFTGCDTVSCFRGKGKERPFDIIVKVKTFRHHLATLGEEFVFAPKVRKGLERFVCHMYGQPAESVDEARYKLFCLNNSTEHSLPPTYDARCLHPARANYQAAIYRRALIPEYDHTKISSPNTPPGCNTLSLQENEMRQQTVLLCGGQCFMH